MKVISRVLLSAAVLGFVACSEQEPKATFTARPLNLTPPPAQATGTATQEGTTAALNPAHGQPNHRCDIPVGTPLSSPAQPSLNTPAIPTTQTVAPGMNPPHGQPGHDCAVPVGAPLNK